MHEGPVSMVTLNDDVPCSTCGYNLRGLDSRGRCPECGGSIGVSLAAHKNRRKSLDEADLTWLTHLLEGAWLALAAWFIALALCVQPERVVDWLTESYSPQRRVVLGTACTWWALSWAAVWKLARREPAAARSRNLQLLPLVRGAASAYLLLPFLIGVADSFPFERLLVVLLFFMVAGGSVAALGLWVRVWALASRDRRPMLQAQAIVLAIASPAALWFTLMTGRGGRDSLSWMIGLPLPGLGWPAVVGDAIEHPSWFFGQPYVGAIALLSHSAVALAVMVQLALMLIGARRRALANAARRTSASSVP